MRKVLLLLTAIFLLAACQGTPRYGGGLYTEETSQRQDNQAPAGSASSSAIDPLAMGRVIDSYLGKPYAGQGQGEKGFDCSEFVDAVYLDYASIHLPRTTEKLYQSGQRVQHGDLYFGDLVFFDTGGRGVSHVGIYIGFNEFVHSSSSNGIIISSLDEKYYRKRYLGARRVME